MHKKKRKSLPVFVILLLAIAPILIAAIFITTHTFRELDIFTLSRREAVAFLAATTVKEKFDRIVDIGTIVSTRTAFQTAIKEGKWEDAVTFLNGTTDTLPYIDTVALFDPSGTVMAVTPPIPSVIGQNFSYRDYYVGVSKNWEPYVSEVFKRAPQPQYNVVSVAIPIKSDPNQNILGILLLTIKLDTIVDWSKHIDVGSGGFVYIVDRLGHLAAHPTLLSDGDIVDYSSVPAVQKILRGDKGVEVLYNPIEQEERISAYQVVPTYDWGVVVVQPTRTGFIERDREVTQMVIIWTLLIGVTGFFTYRLLKSRALIRAQHDREQTFLESIGDGVIAIDRGFTITLWNPAASLITGWSQEEAIGRPFREIVRFIHAHDRTENITFIEEAMLFGKTQTMSNHTLLIRKDGSEIPVGDSAAPILHESGRVDGAIIIFRDTTQEQEAQSIRSSFAYASHQLRTPVTKALWTLEGVMDEKNTAVKNEQIRVAYQSIQSIAKMADQLVFVSEIDQGTILAKKRLLDLGAIIAKVQKAVNGRAKEHNVKMSVNIPTKTMIKTDTALLERALGEVLTNAIIYTAPGGQVKIQVDQGEEGTQITVRDTGQGIPKNQEALVFTKFFRGSNVDTTAIPGAGLGLYLAQSYIHLLGGKIWFEVKKTGTAFYLHLPKDKKIS